MQDNDCGYKLSLRRLYAFRQNRAGFQNKPADGTKNKLFVMSEIVGLQISGKQAVEIFTENILHFCLQIRIDAQMIIASRSTILGLAR